MSLKRWFGYGIEAFLLVVVLSLVAGQILGQPILLSFVTSGSMAPTLGPNDGFVAVPIQVAGPIEVGDVIVFQAQELHGGELTTHRVVGETERGFITRGDANPFTDQDGAEPPVKRAQVVAKAFQINDGVVVIPRLGTVVTGVGAVIQEVQRRTATAVGSQSLLGPQGFLFLIAAVSVIAYVVDLLVAGRRNEKPRERNRSRSSGRRAQIYLLVFAGMIVFAATGSMLLTSGTTQFDVISADFDSPRPDVIPRGESNTQEIVLSNAGLVPMYAFLEPGSEGISIHDRVVTIPSRGEARTRITLSAPPETGYYRRFLVTHRYLAVLPLPAVRALYGIHPWLPIVAIDVELGGLFYVFARPLIGVGRMKSRDRDTGSRTRLTLTRISRKLY